MRFPETFTVVIISDETQFCEIIEIAHDGTHENSSNVAYYYIKCSMLFTKYSCAIRHTACYSRI